MGLILGLRLTGASPFSEAGSGTLQTIAQVQDIHDSLGEGSLQTQIEFLQTNQAEKGAP